MQALASNTLRMEKPSLAFVEEPTSTALTLEKITFVVLRVVKGNDTYDEIVNVDTANRNAIKAKIIQLASRFKIPDCNFELKEGQSEEFNVPMFCFTAIPSDDRLQKPVITSCSNARIAAIACGVLMIGVIIQTLVMPKIF